MQNFDPCCPEAIGSHAAYQHARRDGGQEDQVISPALLGLGGGILHFGLRKDNRGDTLDSKPDLINATVSVYIRLDLNVGDLLVNPRNYPAHKQGTEVPLQED